MKGAQSIFAIASITVLLLTTGCGKDFLDQRDTTGTTEESLFKEPEDGYMLVNGVYDTFHDFNYMLRGLWFTSNFLSQDFRNWGSGTFWNTYEVPTTFFGLDGFWVRSYQGIGRANAALPILEKMKTNGVLTAEQAGRLTAETLFLRAFFYYYLAADFGGVPLELSMTRDDGRHARNTQDEVFAQVVNDMQLASEGLPWKEDLQPAEFGRATRGAALAYLAEAQMWLKKYTDAAAAYRQLEGHYSLEDEFVRIHEFNNPNGKESIFEVQYIAQQDMQNSNNDVHMLTTFLMPEEVSTTGYGYANKLLYESYEAGDERKIPTVIGPGDTHPSPAINISQYALVKKNQGGINTLGTTDNPWKGSDKLRSGYYSAKTWRDPNVTGNVGSPPYVNSGQNLIVMRYGQTLLGLAEALYRSGDEAAAREIIDLRIRNRAGLGPAPVDKPFLQVLLDEYRHELAGEFSLWFVLRRSGEHLAYIQEKFGVTVPPGKDLLPIPQNQIATNPALVQNPGF